MRHSRMPSAAGSALKGTLICHTFCRKFSAISRPGAIEKLLDCMDHYLELVQKESTTMTETHLRGYHPRENGRLHDRVLLAKTQSVETSEEGTLSELPSRSRSRYRGALSQGNASRSSRGSPLPESVAMISSPVPNRKSKSRSKRKVFRRYLRRADEQGRHSNNVPPSRLVGNQANLRRLRTQWMTPTQSLQPSEIAIRGDQFTAVFDGQGRHIGIGDGPSMALHIFTNKSQRVRLGMTKTARGHSTILQQNAKAVCIGVTGRKILIRVL